MKRRSGRRSTRLSPSARWASSLLGAARARGAIPAHSLLRPKGTAYSEELRARLSAWRQIGASPRLLCWIKDGVKIQWRSNPPPSFDHGESLSDATADELLFIRSELARLMALGVIEETDDPGFVSKVFLVPKKGSRKYRLVVDFRHTNSFCPEGTCTVETLRELPNILEREDHMCSLDLTDGYFHVALAEETRRYFTFRVEGKLYRYVGMPFGWNLAPGIFTDLMEPMVRELRSPGWARGGQMGTPGRVLWYLDDLLLCAQGIRATEELRDRAAQLCADLGLTLQREKCQWVPTQRLEHLGLVVDSARGRFGVGPAKLQRVRREAKELLAQAARRQRRAPKRQLAKFAGLAQFTSLAVRQARFRLRSVHDAMGELKGWGGHVRLGRQALADLRWWTRLTEKQSEHDIWRPPETAVLFTDASPRGWGAWINGRLRAQGFWRLEERDVHISVLEMKAVTRAVQSALPDLTGKVVRHHEDNMAVVYAINKLTSPTTQVMEALRELHEVCDRHDITLLTEYIRSEDNVVADGLSRLRPEPAWVLGQSIFDLLGGREVHTIDRFASSSDALLPRFNSRYACPGSAGVDALAQTLESWEAEVNYCNPPWGLLPQLTRRLRESKARATVVAPYWPGATWLPTLRAISEMEVDLGKSCFELRRGARPDRAPPRWPMGAFFVRHRPTAEVQQRLAAAGAATY